MRREKSISLLWRAVLALILVAIPAKMAMASAEPGEAAVLEALADKVISPRLKNMAESAAQLSLAAEDLCHSKDQAGLDKAAGAWRNAYLAWRGADPLFIGPAAKLHLRKRLGYWTTTDTLFKAAVDGEEFAYMRKSREFRGYTAAEYLIFGNADITTATTPGRCSHLLEVTREIASLGEEARAGWEGQYSQGFVAAGDGQPFLLATDAISPVFAGILNSLETLLRDAIGTPSNYFKDKAKPDSLEAWRSKTSGLALQAVIAAIKDTLSPGEPVSLLGLLAEKKGQGDKNGKKLADSIGSRLQTIDRRASDIVAKYPDFHKKLSDDKSLLKPLYKELQKLQDDLVKASLILELDVRTGLEAQLSK